MIIHRIQKTGEIHAPGTEEFFQGHKETSEGHQIDRQKPPLLPILKSRWD
jgi:hypothetical protein